MVDANFGHNEITARLGLLADDAKRALVRVSSGEGEAIEGWLAYGAALNEGRLLHAGDVEFGHWLRSSNLEEGIHPAEQSAAMWAAAHPDQFDAARQEGNARTVRGIHAKWGELNAEKEAEAARVKAEQTRKIAAAHREEAEARRQAEMDARRYAEQAQAEEKAEADRIANEAAAITRQADQDAMEADRTAKTADKVARDANKKAAKVKSKSEKIAHVSNNSGDNEWYTPPTFIEAARQVMGGFDLDPASSHIANQTVGANVIFTEEDDGLAQDWPVGRIWMNPPYAQPLMGQFATKFAAAIRSGSSGIVLVNNATETAWFQEIASVCTAICFPKTRIRFLDPEGNPGAPLQGQAIIYCGSDASGFEDVFCKFGLVMRHG